MDSVSIQAPSQKPACHPETLSTTLLTPTCQSVPCCSLVAPASRSLAARTDCTAAPRCGRSHLSERPHTQPVRSLEGHGHPPRTHGDSHALWELQPHLLFPSLHQIPSPLAAPGASLEWPPCGILGWGVGGMPSALCRLR